MNRQLTNINRTTEVFLARLMATFFFGIFIGTLFLHLTDYTGWLLRSILHFVIMVSAVPILPCDRVGLQLHYLVDGRIAQSCLFVLVQCVDYLHCLW
jgi:hypothetical protein